MTQVRKHPVSEGYMPFLGYQTYYRTVGEPSALLPVVQPGTKVAEYKGIPVIAVACLVKDRWEMCCIIA